MKNGQKKSTITQRKPHAKDPATLDARRADAREMLAAGKSTIAVRSLLKAKYGMALGQHTLLSMRNELLAAKRGKPRFLIGGKYDRRADSSWDEVQKLQAEAEAIVADEERAARVSAPVDDGSVVFARSGTLSVPASLKLAEELVTAKAPFSFDGISIKVRVTVNSTGTGALK